MSESVPPQPPEQPAPTLDYAQGGAGAPCPRCGTFGATPVTFTWWGGFFGPRILHHVRCPSCGYKFNGKTGRSNLVPIAIYSAAGIAIGVVMLFIVFVLL